MENFRSISDDQWKSQLTPTQYQVLRQAGTERPFSHEYESLTDPGFYDCAGCGQRLFQSEMKFDAGCGWPSFFAAEPNAVNEYEDDSHGRHRIEIRCSQCEGHLGHVFPDGPPPSGLRYCLNGTAMVFVPFIPEDN